MTNSRTRTTASAEGPSSIEALRYQELSQQYQCCDYLVAAGPGGSVVTEDIRTEMLEWVSKSTSYMKMHEDIPLLTATLLDRFSQTKQGAVILQCVPDYRLATMGCLYLTSKVHEPSVAISSKVMSAFSQGMFTPAQVEDMELVILTALCWRTNPPTALAFVREFLLLLPSSVSALTKEQTYDLSHQQLQRCMLDYQVFALREASTIAFFVVQYALSSLGMDSITLGHVAAIFSYSTHTDYYSQPENERVMQTFLLGNEEGPSNQQQPNRRRSKKGRRSSLSSTSSSSRKSWTRLRSFASDDSPRGVFLERSR